jgi:hypothetical protein
MSVTGTIRAERAVGRRIIFSDLLLTGILIWCIFSLKFILIGFGESGIRADDLLMLLAFCILLLRGDLRNTRRSRAVNAYLAFIGVSLASALWNSALGRVSPLISLVFVARLSQYLLFYYIGCRVARNRIRLGRILTLDLLLLLIVFPLQKGHLLPLANPDIQPGGNTNGPYELAAVATFFLCYLGYGQRKRVVGLLAFALIVLSESRSTFVGAVLSLGSVLWVRARTPRRRAIFVLVMALVFFSGRAAMNEFQNASAEEKNANVVGRLASAAGGVSWDTVTGIYDSVPVYGRSSDYIGGVFSSTDDLAEQVDADHSGLDRLFRWTTLLKSTVAAPDSLLIGVGPSFGSAAVDGYFTRVFIETGLIGLGVFCWFLSRLIRGQTAANWPFHQYVFVLIVTGCFIDIFVSYKPMILLWLWHGMQTTRETLSGKVTSVRRADSSLAAGSVEAKVLC